MEYKNFEKIKYIDIKNIGKNSLEIISDISDNEEFFNLKSIANASMNDVSFFQMKNTLKI